LHLLQKPGSNFRVDSTAHAASETDVFRYGSIVTNICVTTLKRFYSGSCSIMIKNAASLWWFGNLKLVRLSFDGQIPLLSYLVSTNRSDLS